MYGATSLASHFPRSQTPNVTAGLKWAPEICPPAKIITMSAEPIANGANAPAPLPITVHPMVRTRKKVPINSAMYLFMPDLLQTLDERDLWKGLDLQGARIVLPTCVGSPRITSGRFPGTVNSPIAGFMRSNSSNN